MKCPCGSSLFPSLAAVVGLVGIGLGGYNVVTTGCPLGSCHDRESTPRVAAVGTVGDKASACCWGQQAEACDHVCTQDCDKNGATCPKARKADEVAAAPSGPTQTKPGS